MLPVTLEARLITRCPTGASHLPAFSVNRHSQLKKPKQELKNSHPTFLLVPSAQPFNTNKGTDALPCQLWEEDGSGLCLFFPLLLWFLQPTPHSPTEIRGCLPRVTAWGHCDFTKGGEAQLAPAPGPGPDSSFSEKPAGHRGPGTQPGVCARAHQGVQTG